MAKTAGAAGFTFRRNLKGQEHASTEVFRVGDSKTITVGDAVRINTSGVIDLATAGVPLLGIVKGICDELNAPLNSLGYINGTGATVTGDDTVTTASDNSSRTSHWVMVEVAVDPAGNDLYYNDANGDLAQTNIMQLFDVVAAADQIDASSASDTSGQFQLISIDPDADADASKGVFRMAEKQLINHLGNATTVISA